MTESDGTVVGDSNGYFVTDSAGTILIEGIDPGTTLVVKETRAKDGFLLDDTPQTAQIKAGQTVTLEFRNQPTGQLIIHKLSGDDRKTPLEGVQFKITYSDGSFVDADSGQLSSNGLYWSNSAGQIILSGLTGTVVVTEVESIPGYTIDPNTQSQTVVINPNDTQELYFYNNPIGGIEIIKVNASKTSERIPDTTFEIRRMDDALVDTITTDRNGRAYLSLEDGSYYALEVEANPDFVLDDTPHYFEVKNGEVTTLRIKNEANSGILIHKVDTSGEGIYGVKFLLYDEDRNPIGEFTSDDEGWVYITADDLPDGANTSGRFYLRELEAAEGYILDEEYKTVYVRPGRTAEIEWVNTAITGQIQIWKKSADDNPINGFPAGTPLEGAVFGIYNKANALVDTVESDSRGLAVSKPLPLGRYTVKEISSPQFYSVSDEEVTVYLEHEGQIVQVEYLNESVYTNVSISKSGYTQVVPGQEIRYTFKDIGNNSTVPLDSFYWRDTLPTDAVRLDKIITGTYSARLNYKVVFQTNLNDTQRVLADNLNTQKNYTLDASPAALGLASNEYVTQVTFLFGRVPGGFKQVETPYIYCDVLSSLSHEYRFANKCDVGGMWQNQWVQATDRWVTIIYRGGPVPTLPRTGY
ncbi:MAG: SpaA isopeptide-forming pilin-related protein [Eubacteriales bacterium]